MHAADPGTPARLATLDDVLAATPGTVSVWCGRLGEPPAYTRRPNVRHYAESEGETILQLHGTGPWSLTYVNPSDDPRRRTP